MMNNELTAMTAVEAAAKIRAKEISPVELTRAAWSGSSGWTSGSTLTSPCAMGGNEGGPGGGARRDGRGDAGPLHMVPIAVKDLYDTAGVRTTARSHLGGPRARGGFRRVGAAPAGGAILLGKTNTHEWAYGTWA